jgi:hypothetical protein
MVQAFVHVLVQISHAMRFDRPILGSNRDPDPHLSPRLQDGVETDGFDPRFPHPLHH